MLEEFDMYAGGKCPHCNQNVKIYRRPMYDKMIQDLIRLARSGPGFHHINDFGHHTAGGGDFAKLKYWGFCEEQPNPNNPKKKCSGMWKVTRKGIQFLKGEITAPTHAIVYNRELQGMSTTMHSVKDCLGVQFDYSELMGITYG